MKITKQNIADVYKAKRSSVSTMELKGYELIEEVMVDNSGFGLDDEYALTPAKLELKLSNLLNECGTLYAILTDVGQFQVYLGLLKKVSKSKAKLVKANTYEYMDGDTRVIRLYDTDILRFKDSKITFNTGGFDTKLTRERMNDFLPRSVRVGRDKGVTYVYHNGRHSELVDGLTIEL